MSKNNFVVLILIFEIFLGFRIYDLGFRISAQERIESPNYRIIFPNFNSGAGIPSSDNYDLNTTIDKLLQDFFHPVAIE